MRRSARASRVVTGGMGKSIGRQGPPVRFAWSKKAIAAAKACSGIARATPGVGRTGRRSASIARVVRAYYLGQA